METLINQTLLVKMSSKNEGHVLCCALSITNDYKNKLNIKYGRLYYLAWIFNNYLLTTVLFVVIALILSFAETIT